MTVERNKMTVDLNGLSKVDDAFFDNIEEKIKEERNRRDDVRKAKRPQRLPRKDWNSELLIDHVKSYINFVWSPKDNPERDRMEESDFEYFIFSAAITMIYGSKIWPLIRERQK